MKHETGEIKLCEKYGNAPPGRLSGEVYSANWHVRRIPVMFAAFDCKEI